MDNQESFLKELESLINRYSIENGSDTPDFILAEYLGNCLVAYQQTITKRDKWFGVDMWSADKLKHDEPPISDLPHQSNLNHG